MPRLARQESMFLDDDYVAEFKEAFELFDIKRTESIKRGDLRQVLQQFGIRVTDEAFDDMFEEADQDKNGVIDFPEFLTMMGARMRQTSTEQRLRAAFRTFDPKQKGFIPTSDLSEALLSLGTPLERKELNELLKIAENQNQEVKYDLFVNMMFTKK